MNTTNIFAVLLNLNIKQSTKLLSISKYMISLNNKYLWKLLYIRNYKINCIIKSYYNSCVLCNNIIKINMEYNVFKLYKLTNICKYNCELQSLPSEIGLFNNL